MSGAPSHEDRETAAVVEKGAQCAGIKFPSKIFLRTIIGPEPKGVGVLQDN